LGTTLVYGNVLLSAAADLTVNIAPDIVVQPISMTGDPGEEVVFSVNATGGTGTLTYQWYHRGSLGTYSPITSASLSTYTITSLTTTGVEVGLYRCFIGDDNFGPSIAPPCACVESDTVSLEVFCGAWDVGTLPITTPPVGASFGSTPFTFSVVANGTPSYTYQWYKSCSSSAIPDATLSTLTVTWLLTTSPYGQQVWGNYSVEVTDSGTPALVGHPLPVWLMPWW
jgi:hypothetical protein